MSHETRERLALSDAELRSTVAEDGTRTLTGLIPYNSRSVDLGGFVEQIDPSSFAEALKPGQDILCLRDHNTSLLLGRTKSGTMTLTNTPVGLRYTVKLPNTTVGNDLAESIARGDLDATSFGFTVPKDGDTWQVVDNQVVRTLRSINLLEISCVSFPAYPASSASIRSAPREIQERIKPLIAAEDDLTACTCDCDQCELNNCAGCTDTDCDCDGCTCPAAVDNFNNEDADEDEERTRRYMALNLRQRS